MIIGLIEKIDKYLLLVHLGIILLFSFIYYFNKDLFIGHTNESDKDVTDKSKVFDNLSDSGFINCLYFSAVVHTTTGFGRIYPINDKAKIIVFIHIILAFSTIVIL